MDEDEGLHIFCQISGLITPGQKKNALKAPVPKL
jgi:hypothetical protein